MTGSVAVIGAGPGGLVAARWLLSQGFEPTIFEQSPVLGGQWSGLDGRSGVWPNMNTNTSRVMTAFSDLEHDSDLVFPSNREILALSEPVRRDVRPAAAHPLRHPGRAAQPQRAPAGWWTTAAATSVSTEWWWPAADFKRRPSPRSPAWTPSPGPRARGPPSTTASPTAYRGKRVLVAGCAVSALEIATELAATRRGPRGGHPAATALRPAEVRRRRAVGPPDLHPVRRSRHRDPPITGGRPPAQGDRGRGRRQPGAVRRTRTGSVAVRRRCHAQSELSAAGRRGANRGAPVDGVRRGNDGDLRRRERRGVRRHRVRHRIRAGPAVPE